MPGLPPDVPKGFDDEDVATLRAMISDFRRRQALRETVTTWSKYLLAAAASLVAITQLRDFIRSLWPKL